MEKMIFKGVLHLKNEPAHYHLIRETGQNAFNFVHFLSPVVIVIDDLDIVADKNACIIFSPNTRQEYYALSEGLTNNYVTFGIDDPYFISRFNLPVNEVFYIENGDRITEIVEFIAWARTDDYVDHTEELYKHLYLLLNTLSELQIMNDTRRQRAFQMKNQFIKLRDRIRNNPSEWTVAKMAKSVYLTRSRFYILYLEFFNKTPSEDLISMTLEYAKNALLESNESVAAIAHKCGYNSVEHFIRLFRKREHMTPGQFRKNSQTIPL